MTTSKPINSANQLLGFRVCDFIFLLLVKGTRAHRMMKRKTLNMWVAEMFEWLGVIRFPYMIVKLVRLT